MSLNIKNERTHALVRELAARTGATQSDAVADAVARRLAELSAAPQDDDARDLRIDVALARVRGALTEVDRATIGLAEADLYDRDGLFR